MDTRSQCREDIKAHCKKNYIVAGPITGKQGRVKCRNTLREAGVWGKDKSTNCINDPELCNHTRCADVSESYNNGFQQTINEVEHQLPSNVDLAKQKLNTSVASGLNKFKNVTTSFGGKRKTNKKRKTIKKKNGKRKTNKKKKSTKGKSVKRVKKRN
tara:strand:+ start:204 stop:674 length:471 start_codon:yes stop_codon:yes gene_type:complete